MGVSYYMDPITGNAAVLIPTRVLLRVLQHEKRGKVYYD